MKANRTVTSAGETVFTLQTGHTFTMPPLDQAERNSAYASIFDGALEVLNELSADTARITADETLSRIGREQKLEPIRRNAVLMVALSWTNLLPFERDLDKREATMLAVPQIHPTHSVEAIEDREIRDWWRGLPVKERATTLARFDSEPGLARIELALLRSPVAIADLELMAVRASWDRARRVDNMGEAIAISSGRAALDWARRGLGHVAGVMSSVLGWSTDRIAREILSSKEEGIRQGFPVFGISQEQAAHVGRIISVTSKRAA